MKKIKNWLIKNFYCSTIFSKGHIPEPFLYEDQFSIHTKRCKNCKSILGIGKWKVIRDFPPHNSSLEQIKEWEKYCEKKFDDLRQSVKK